MTESMLDKLREIIIFVAGLVALGSLLMAAYEGLSQRVATATFFGGLALACIMVVHLPQLDALKAFGMEAKWREIREAVATLKTVRRLAEISARASYLTIAWGNRFGTPPAKDRQAVLDDIDAQLAELKVTPQERATIIQPWVRMIKTDFFFVFTRVVWAVARLKAAEISEMERSLPSDDKKFEASTAHSKLITPWSERDSTFGGMDRLKSQSLSAVIDQWMPSKGGWLSDKELAVIDTFKNEVIRLNDDSEKRGGYTPEAAAFYDGLFEREADKAKELWALSKR